ncbi:GNAT family N-acetyltransferase [Hyphomonas johnsonii]|uniref:GCN5-like N-acetyltransferase n=1 Tax=Hyphomonas johnsonii MHS-2 TaxID=1280950 RepID=A0A059FS21_9PROT|nr:GNAT family N-acetyltransferase [Hyphomonas johnsonii]KCZ93460.1 GCN5-like N-acetyltransferase [Hyphomonas johnsonii MHS-2]
MTVLIRTAEGPDCARLAEIEELCFRDGYSDKMLSREEFRDLVADDVNQVLVATDGAQVCGYALLLVERDENAGYFDSLAIDPQFQGKGIGEDLFKAVETTCVQMKLGVLNLEIKENNYTLLKRYHRFGYKCFQVEEAYYADGWSALRMRKTVAAIAGTE